ncbi:MAG: iron-containing redox enzyme family protein [Actinomycetota bacterium]|nr:iron-containing redox enzyme family protein [Actinomycetota bacterium]
MSIREVAVELPRARGPLSSYVIEGLSGGTFAPGHPPVSDHPLRGDDLHLALYLCYELHYEGFAGVDPRVEWDPDLLAFRRTLEGAFEAALLEAVPIDAPTPGEGVADRLIGVVTSDDGPPLARFVETRASVEQARELVMHRSAYQLKEADPHSWVIPRLRGPGKAALIEIQSDEYGSGRADRVHATLFGKTMTAVGLDSAYGRYIEELPGVTLATVNLVSMFGLHRRWMGAAIGHLVAFEMTSSEPNRRYGNGLRRLGFGRDATDFYDEHVEADSVHEVIALHDLAAAVVAADPAMERDILFGARSLLAIEGRWAARLLEAWAAGRSSLRAVVQPAP